MCLTIAHLGVQRKTFLNTLVCFSVMTKTGVFKMFNLYNTIKELCDSRGISVSKMSSDIGIHRNVMPRLKASEWKKTLSLQTLEKLSAYFDVPITYFIDEKDADRHGSSPTIGTKSKSLELQRFKALFPCISTVCGHSIVSHTTHRVSFKTHFTLQNVIRFVI